MVVVECEWVLRSFYKLEKEAICDRLESLVSLSTLTVPNQGVLGEALGYYRWRNVDLTDAYLAASAAQFDTNRVVTFDKDFDLLPVKRVP